MASQPFLARKRRVEQFKHGRILPLLRVAADDRCAGCRNPPFEPCRDNSRHTLFHPGITCKRQIALSYIGQLIANQVGDVLTIHIIANYLVEVLNETYRPSTSSK